MYTALHRSKEAVIITDDLLRTQYANKSSERLLNMKLVCNKYYFYIAYKREIAQNAQNTKILIIISEFCYF